MRIVSAGDGYKYLLTTVAAGDGDRDLSTPLTRYYDQTGTPPGRWAGTGLASLATTQITPGQIVTERQLERLIGHGLHPVTGQPLGARYIAQTRQPTHPGRAGTSRNDPDHPDPPADPAAPGGKPDRPRAGRRAVAGFDYTFSVPKSVSVLWGLADAGTQALIAQAHHHAVADVISFMERHVAATRTGRAGIVQADVTGLLATVYDHYDSRSGDPQLHSHVVVANKVCTTGDGKWRTLDSRILHAATVAISEHYNAVLADTLTRMLGVGWDRRDRGRDRNPAHEITGVSEDLISLFSTRSHDIDTAVAGLIADYVTAHHRQPSARTVIRLRQQATLTTRPDKHLHSLAELTTRWRQQAEPLTGPDPTGWASGVIDAGPQVLLRADDIPLAMIDDLATSVIETVSERRTVWRRWNLHAEATRHTAHWRFATASDRETVTAMITDTAQAVSIRLTPDPIPVPAQFQRADGTSVFRPKNSALFTCQAMWDAETRLLTLSRTRTGPGIDTGTIWKVASHPDRAGRTLSEDQAGALGAIATSRRVIDVLVGPAGAGKTTCLAALRTAWETGYGTGSVVGLAPSATAAAVLGQDLGIATENTAKWLTEHHFGRAQFETGQLVIVDEASLAGTFTLDQIAHHAHQVGAKLLLVGDWAQLHAVDAGGAFPLLAGDRDDTPELCDIHRFTHDWEKTASLALRHAHPEAIDTYQAHGRITEGDLDTVTETAYQAWATDVTAGRTSVLIADAHDLVTDLNQRARHDRIRGGHVNPTRHVTLQDGSHASTGDQVITRRNDRRLVAGRSGWVRNGDRWTITRVHHDGALTIQRQHTHAKVVLPADYVTQHVDLGYAITAHRAQGITVDTAHCLVTAATTRENLYVAMTRGRRTNTAYVAIDRPDETHTTPHPNDLQPTTARTVLAGVLANTGAEPSAHQTLTSEHDQWGSIRQLAAERGIIETAALAAHWAGLIRATDLTPTQGDLVITSDAFRPLCVELHRAHTTGQAPETLLRAAIHAGRLDTTGDPAAVLCRRVEALNDHASAATRHRPTRMIAGIIPNTDIPISPDMRTALDQYNTAIADRAHDLVRRATHQGQSWLRVLGARPTHHRDAQRWDRVALTLAAYRELHDITGPDPYGTPSADTTQRRDLTHVRALVASLSQPAHAAPPPALPPPRPTHVL